MILRQRTSHKSRFRQPRREADHKGVEWLGYAQSAAEPEMRMDHSDRKRPVLASVICIVAVITSGPTLLRALHLIPPLTSFPAPTDHVLLHHVLTIVEPVLNLLGAIFLWQMRPVATILFAAEAIVLILSGLYLAFIDPSERMLTLRASRHETVIYLLIVAFECALIFCVWRITPRPQNIASESVLSN
jgi:hypothetical protein